MIGLCLIASKAARNNAWLQALTCPRSPSGGLRGLCLSLLPVVSRKSLLLDVTFPGLYLGRPAKPLPAAKADLELLFEFSRWEKILYVSQWIHLRFFPIAKIEEQLNLHFLATGRFCRPPLGANAGMLESESWMRRQKS